MIDHEGRVREMLNHRGPVPGGGVQRRQGDPSAPGVAASGEPVAQHVSGAVLEDFEDPVAVQVQDLGRERRAMFGRGVQEPLLVDTDRGHAVKPARLLDHGIGELADRPVGGVPPHTELGGGSRDRHPLEVDHRRQQLTGPLGHRHPS